MTYWIASLLGFLAGTGITALYYQCRDRHCIKHGIERRKKDKKGMKRTALLVQDNGQGEPTVHTVKGPLIKPSPVPASLAVVLVIFGAFSIGTSLVSSARDRATRLESRVNQCQNFAQLKARGDDTRASYLILGSALKKVANPSPNADARAQNRATINQLADYYLAQGSNPGGLPPLTSEAQIDCKDGAFNNQPAMPSPPR